MRINCAACSHTHNSDIVPFLHNMILDDDLQKQEVPIYDPESKETNQMVHYSKHSHGEFVCENCGTVNNVGVKWTAVRPKSEETTALLAEVADESA